MTMVLDTDIKYILLRKDARSSSSEGREEEKRCRGLTEVLISESTSPWTPLLPHPDRYRLLLLLASTLTRRYIRRRALSVVRAKRLNTVLDRAVNRVSLVSNLKRTPFAKFFNLVRPQILALNMLRQAPGRLSVARQISRSLTTASRRSSLTQASVRAFPQSNSRMVRHLSSLPAVNPPVSTPLPSDSISTFA